jgi:hypothetical protein
LCGDIVRHECFSAGEELFKLLEQASAAMHKLSIHVHKELTPVPSIVQLMIRLPERIALQTEPTRLCHQRLGFSGREISPEKGVHCREVSSATGF